VRFCRVKVSQDQFVWRHTIDQAIQAYCILLRAFVYWLRETTPYQQAEQPNSPENKTISIYQLCHHESFR
ncbi:MAG: hypothetical protein AAGA31_14135, partial [Bacteroidota bacterium]